MFALLKLLLLPFFISILHFKSFIGEYTFSNRISFHASKKNPGTSENCHGAKNVSKNTCMHLFAIRAIQ